MFDCTVQLELVSEFSHCWLHTTAYLLFSNIRFIFLTFIEVPWHNKPTLTINMLQFL